MANPPYNILQEIMGRVQELSNAVAPSNQRNIADDTIVPRQGVRVWLSEHGHILSGFEFFKEWNACQVELAIKEAFEDKLSAHTDFEILMSVHSTLVVPTLAPGQNGLNGVMIHRIFKESLFMSDQRPKL